MKVLAALRWFISVGSKLFRVVPWASSLIVICTLASQIASLLAALLPLKVIILLGSEHIPSYFPSQMQEHGKAALIVGLGAAALAFFALHLFAEWLIARLATYGAHLLIAHSRKLTLFENQEQLLTRAYQRFAEALAGSVFILLSAVALALIYPLQAAVIATYATAVWIVLSWQQRDESELLRLIGVLANLGFFVTFATIVLDVLLGTQVSVFWAVITLLLVRQLFRRMSTLVSDVANLYSQRLQLNALLFQGHLYVGKALIADTSGVWALAHSENFYAWLLPLIERVVGPDAGDCEMCWVQSGTPDVLMGVLRVCSPSLERSYLVKLFGKNRVALARHEASLFGVMNDGASPLPRLCLVDQVDNFNCHVFDWPTREPVAPQAAKRAAVSVTAGLFAVRPSGSLVALYTRSRPMLWQRLNDSYLVRLRLFARGAERLLVERFASVQTDIKACLGAMPLAIITPELSPDALWRDSQDRVWASQWGRWSLEPIGGGWSVSDKNLRLLPAIFEQAQQLRPDLRTTTVKHTELAALMFAFDKACQRQAYRTAIELIEPILSAYDGIGGQTSKG